MFKRVWLCSSVGPSPFVNENAIVIPKPYDNLSDCNRAKLITSHHTYMYTCSLVQMNESTHWMYARKHTHTNAYEGNRSPDVIPSTLLDERSWKRLWNTVWFIRNFGPDRYNHTDTLSWVFVCLCVCVVPQWTCHSTPFGCFSITKWTIRDILWPQLRINNGKIREFGSWMIYAWYDTW